MSILILTTLHQNTDSNPLLEDYHTPHQTPPFDRIRTEHYKPAFQEAIRQAGEEIKEIGTLKEEASFENTIVALDNAGDKLNDISSLFFNLNNACTNDEIQQIAQDISPWLTEFSNSIYMNKALFERVKQIYANKEKQSLTAEQNSLLENTWRSFIKGGANLAGEDQDRFSEITVQLSKLSLTFDENMLAETNGYELHLTDEKQLSGLPESTVEAAAMTAAQKDKKGWIFTLHAPSYVPFLKYADDRSLREQLYKAYTSRCNRDNKHNNESVIRDMVSLRLEKARLMGYDTYAAYALTDRMAKTPETVNTFLAQLFEASHPFALREKQEVEEYARRNGFKGGLQRWDWAYYSNKLKQEKYALNDEMLKPYFKLENVRKGIFDLAYKLYGITFKEVDNIPKYHEDIKTFEVYDRDNSFLAVFYADFFPRESKGGGAWMTDFRGQKIQDGKDVRPFVSIVCNFTKPTPSKPSLLTFDEVTTFLHEFGHALHGMLSRCNYASISGTNVYRDFVELPSQLMENWALEKEWLDTWAVHYLTGEKIPREYISKIKKAANFQSGYQNDRQLSFSLVDMAWHTLTVPFQGKTADFEKQAVARTEIFTAVEGSCFSSAFGHIFGGGYAAGYYSYKWAEVLDADAFSLFKQNGIFDRQTAESFRKNILEKGGSEHPMTLYVRFRGQEPSVNALLERSGLIALENKR